MINVIFKNKLSDLAETSSLIHSDFEMMVQYCIDKLELEKYQIEEIEISFKDMKKKSPGHVTHMTVAHIVAFNNPGKKFRITINSNVFGVEWADLGKVLNDVAHEFQHIKQYASGMMYDIGDTTYWEGRAIRSKGDGFFSGMFMTDDEKHQEYLDYPWEVDARAVGDAIQKEWEEENHYTLWAQG